MGNGILAIAGIHFTLTRIMIFAVFYLNNGNLPKSECSMQNPFPDYESSPYITPIKKKVGRNEPCPCGSGIKYKKCCGKVV